MSITGNIDLYIPQEEVQKILGEQKKGLQL